MNAPSRSIEPDSLELPMMWRDASVANLRGAKGDTIELTFSSEDPYERHFGIEILGHKASEVDLSWMASGRAPLLVDHDNRVDSQIGTVVKAWLQQGRGKALVRFGNNARSQEIRQRIEAGELTNVSVGYRVDEMELVGERKGGLQTYRVTRWKPMEASIVSIPADPTVGVGRSDDHVGAQRVVIRTRKANTMTTEPNAGTELAERNRVSALLDMGRHFNRLDLAESAIREGATVDRFRNILLDALESETVPTRNMNANTMGLSSRDQRRFADFSIGKLIAAQLTGDWSQAGAEREVSQELSRKAGRPATGMWIPSSALATRNTQVAASNTLVGVEHQFGSFINSLTNKALVMEMGATRLAGLIESVSIPRQAGNASAAWYAEDASITESTPSFDAVTMAPKQVSGRIAYSKKLMVQSLPDIEQLMVNDLQRQIGLAIDVAAIHGTGASNQPTGIIATSGINTIALGTNGLAPTWAHIVQMETEVSVDNANAGTMGYLTNSKVRGKLKVTEKASSTGQFVWQDGLEGFGTVNGYKAGVTNQVSSTLTKGSSSGVCSAILFGNWADLLIGEWGAIDLVIDPYSDGAKANVRIYAHAFVDIAVRQPVSFCAILDALTT